MNQTLAAPDIENLNQKLDVLTTQVQFLTEQAELALRRQEARTELVEDVVPIANDAFRIITEQLEEVQEYVDLCDILRLAKRLLRNGRNIDKMLDQLESMMDLAQTVGPLTDSAFEKATDLLQTAEQKGYFTLAKGGVQAVDRFVTSLEEEPIDTSLRALLRQMRDPDVRRGLSIAMRLLREFGAQTVKT